MTVVAVPFIRFAASATETHRYDLHFECRYRRSRGANAQDVCHRRDRVTATRPRSGCVVPYARRSSMNSKMTMTMSRIAPPPIYMCVLQFSGATMTARSWSSKHVACHAVRRRRGNAGDASDGTSSALLSMRLRKRLEEASRTAESRRRGSRLNLLHNDSAQRLVGRSHQPLRRH